jgi:hypothetical protein
MATTAESVHDGLLWIARLLLVGLKRAAIIGVFVGLFALAVWATTKPSYSDCDDVTPQQRAQLESLREPSPPRNFLTSSEPRCRRGVFAASVSGLGADMETVTAALTAQEWIAQDDFLPYFHNSWVRCFRFSRPDWERIELNVVANRAGEVRTVEASAPENRAACTEVSCSTTTVGCVSIEG